MINRPQSISLAAPSYQANRLRQGYSIGGPRAKCGPPIISMRPESTPTAPSYFLVVRLNLVWYARGHSGACSWMTIRTVCMSAPTDLRETFSVRIFQQLLCVSRISVDWTSDINHSLVRFLFPFHELAKRACITVGNDSDSFRPFCHWIIWSSFSVSKNK